MQSPASRETSPALTPAALAAWQAFLRAHTVVTRVLERELLASQRLPLAEYDVLVQLSEAPQGRLRMAQLADRVLLSRSGLTRLVERLEAGGLVRREVCPSDARGAFAVLTAEGATLLLAAAPDHLKSVQAHFGNVLDSEQMSLLRTALDQVVSANMAEANGGCPSLTEAHPVEGPPGD
ncbi:MAG: MarR family winged helix-turn-helix transcriptional regulator [Candidatus Dormibacteria bacterium]